MPEDQRLIEDYIPIEAISNEARREKSIRKGHISTLHLWWARRPLVAARAAVYGALVPAPQGKRAARQAAQFVADLCKYPGSESKIAEARQHILQAHAARLTQERGELVTVADIEAGRAPRPRLLDMFAGGGAIPLEALRLGCEAYALDLNPVAHLIELCTLVYPQRFGAPDPASHGSAADGSWAGLAAEVEHWGKWVLERARLEIGDLYPPIPDPEKSAAANQPAQLNMNLAAPSNAPAAAPHMLTPVAYLWTRTVRCKNPACRAIVPLARQTWLAKKKGRSIALQPIPSPEGSDASSEREKRVHYRVVEATTAEGLGFDPESGSKGGNVACPFCGTVADSTYVKTEGQARRIDIQPMVVVCSRPKKQGKIYLGVDQVSPEVWPKNEGIWQRICALKVDSHEDLADSLTIPDELIEANPRSMDIQNYGFQTWADLFIPRQLLVMLTFTKYIHRAHSELLSHCYCQSHIRALAAFLGLWVDRVADYGSGQCTWKPGGEFIASGFSRQSVAMVWDFAEVNPVGNASGNSLFALKWILDVIRNLEKITVVGHVERGSATQAPFENNIFDAIITDPPYYDNVTYSNLSDFFYVWLKRTVGQFYPEHLSSLLTPKKKEAIAAFYRHKGNRVEARQFYENMMAMTFAEAGRLLKPSAPLVIVYAHKTTLGWATLVDALRFAGYTVTEAWPLDTERPGRTTSIDTAALASSIFLVARHREDNATGSYERAVRPELHAIVRERLERLWAQGVTGADLVIACVGAGLRAFTRYARVEYANGEAVPADSFLAEVEGAVLEALLEKLFGVSGAGLGRIDPPTRFYVLWRYAYRQAALDAGEAIVFAYPQHVELEGPHALTSGPNPLVTKHKNQYLLHDFTERGQAETLGLPPALKLPASAATLFAAATAAGARGEPADLPPLIDALHRLLWLVENRPALIPAYLDQASPDLERLRLVAQTLAGQTLAGNGEGGGKSLVAARGAEAAALRKLTTNWRTLIEAHRGPLG